MRVNRIRRFRVAAWVGLSLVVGVAAVALVGLALSENPPSTSSSVPASSTTTTAAPQASSTIVAPGGGVDVTDIAWANPPQETRTESEESPAEPEGGAAGGAGGVVVTDTTRPRSRPTIPDPAPTTTTTTVPTTTTSTVVRSGKHPVWVNFWASDCAKTVSGAYWVVTPAGTPFYYARLIVDDPTHEPPEGKHGRGARVILAELGVSSAQELRDLGRDEVENRLAAWAVAWALTFTDENEPSCADQWAAVRAILPHAGPSKTP